MPGDGLTAGLLEHPRPDREDHPGVFEHGQEVLGLDDTPDRVAPTKEGFHPPDSDAVELEDGLVDEEELVLLERLTQVGLELEALHAGGLHG